MMEARELLRMSERQFRRSRERVEAGLVEQVKRRGAHRHNRRGSSAKA
jgi:hypothetical protein